MATIAPFIVIGSTPIWNPRPGYYCGIAGHDIDGDGSGGKQDNDETYQPETTLKNDDGSSLDSTKIPFSAWPEIFVRKTPEIIMGSLVRVTLLSLPYKYIYGVAGDIGPDDKFGEGSIFSAKSLDPNNIIIPSSPRTGGTTSPCVFWELFAGQAALLNGVQYKLQPLK